jgi:tape measure domain-containing protein
MANKVEYSISLKDLFSAGIKKAADAVTTLDKKVDSLGRFAKKLSFGNGVFSGAKKAGDEVENTGRKVKGLKRDVDNLNRSGFGIGKWIATLGITAGLMFAGKAVFDLGVKSEQTQVAFETLLGSATKAKSLISDLQSFASITPFNTDQLTDLTKQLLAYGFAQEEVIPNMKALGDIAAGVGMEKLPFLTLAYGQVRTAGKLTGAELRQFTENGVPLLAELAKNMGKTTAEVQDLIHDGSVGFKDVQLALAGLTGEGGRFFNLMEKQGKTVGGRISTLKDNLQLMAMGLGQALLPVFGEIVDRMTFTIDWVKTNFNQLKDVFRPLWDAVQPLLFAFKEILGDLGLMNSQGSLLSSIFNGLGSIIKWLAPLVKFFGSIISTTIGLVWTLVKALWEMIKPIAKLLGFKETDFGFKDPEKKEVKFQGLGEFLKTNPNGIGGAPAGSTTLKDQADKGSKIQPRNVTINIGKFQESINIHTSNLKESSSKIAEEINKAILAVVNDTNRLAGV